MVCVFDIAVAMESDCAAPTCARRLDIRSSWSIWSPVPEIASGPPAPASAPERSSGLGTIDSIAVSIARTTVGSTSFEERTASEETSSSVYGESVRASGIVRLWLARPAGTTSKKRLPSTVRSRTVARV